MSIALIGMCCMIWGLSPSYLTQAEAEVDKFLKEEHSFLEYEKLVLKYKDTSRELQYSVEKVSR